MKRFFIVKIALSIIIALLLFPFVTNILTTKVEAADWYNVEWEARKLITVDNTSVCGSSNFTNYPFMVSIDADPNLVNLAQSSGDDILFTASDGTTKIDHEIEYYNPSTGQLVAWVKVPTLNATIDTEVYMYYGNSLAVNQENETGVWNDYDGVFHFAENPAGASPQVQDSTINNNDGTTFGTMTSGDLIAGVGGFGYDFDNSDDYVNFGDQDEFDYGAAESFTVSIWFNSSDTNSQLLNKKALGQTGWDFIVGEASTPGNIQNRLEGDNDVGANGNVQTGTADSQWHQFVMVVDRSTNVLRTFVDGAQVGGTVSVAGLTGFGSTTSLQVGARTNSPSYGGLADELRLRRSVSSADWLCTEYENLSSPETFSAIGAQEVIPLTANQTIEFTGKIIDKTDNTSLEDGDPSCIVAGDSNDTCDLRASIYTQSAGGTAVWVETHENKEMGQYSGNFNLQLNSICGSWNFPTTPCSGDGVFWESGESYYLELSFDTDGNGDFSGAEIFERKLLTSAPYAQYAERAGSIDGLIANDFLKLQPGTPQSSGDTSNTLININEAGAGTPDLLDIKVAGTSAFKVLNDGTTTIASNLAIGLTSPTAMLEITNESTSQSSFKVNQEIDYWLKAVGGGSNDMVAQVTKAHDGGMYVTGDTNSFGAGGSDAYVIKYDINGNIVYDYTIGGGTSDAGNSVQPTADGGYVLAFDSQSLSTQAATAAAVSKVDAAGVIEWTQILEGGIFENFAASGIAQTSDGGYIINGASTESTNKMIGYKLDSSGNLEWSTQIYGGTDDRGTSAKVLEYPDGGFVISGYTSSFGAGSTDFFIAKLNSSGTVEWSKTIGGASSEILSSIIIASNGSIIAVGNTDSYGAGNTDMFIVSLDSLGNLNYSKAIGTVNADAASDIVQMRDGSFVIAGYYDNGANNDGVILSLNSTMTTINWTRSIGGSSSDILYSIDRSNFGVFVGGDTSSFGAGGVDGFVASLDNNGQCGACAQISTITNPSLATPTATIATNGSSNSYGTASSASPTASSASTFTSTAVCTSTETVNVLDIGATGSSRLNSQLEVSGDIYGDTIYGREIRLSNFDLAEEYIVEDRSIKAGEVIRLKKDTEDNRTIERAEGRYDSEVIGVVSTAPGIYLRDWNTNNKNGRPVALAGRVPVKVSTENGEIRRGDYLTVSSEGGYAMKATEPGYIIGRAMEDLTNPGNSSTVEELIEVVEEREGGEEYTEEIINESNLITTDNNQQNNNTTLTKGRIMMYVDLGYVGEEVYREREEAMKALEINRYELENGSRLFELVEDSNLTSLKLNIDKLIVAGSVEIEGDLDVKGIITGSKVKTEELEVGGIEISEDSGVSGEVEIPAGQTKVYVENSRIKESSKILVTPNRVVEYWISKKEDGLGFEISIENSVSENIKFNYLVL